MRSRASLSALEMASCEVSPTPLACTPSAILIKLHSRALIFFSNCFAFSVGAKYHASWNARAVTIDAICHAPQVTLPSEPVSLNRLVLGGFYSSRFRRGGGNVGIGFIDFQGLWEVRKTARSFSALSIDRHFHGLLQSPSTFMRRASSAHWPSPAQTASG